MTQLSILNRPGMTAIAAFAALSSTPLLAQAADPLAASSDPAPSVTTTPPIDTTTSAPVTAPVVVADPLAPAATKTVAAKPVAKTARTTTTRSATRTVTRTQAATVAPARAAVPVAVAAPVASVAAPVEVVPPLATPQPLPPESPVATAPVAAPVSGSSLPADALPIAGAGLGALALAAAALAMRRRRRLNDEREELRYDEPAFVATAAPVAPEPALPPEPVRTAAPIMAWDAPATAAPLAAAAPVATHPLVDGEVPPGIDPQSHAAAAYRGPSADNPSLSLQKRLKRAAFFDQREKLVAAGMATPLARDAGLPEAMDVPDAPRADPVPATATATVRPLTSGGNFSYKPAFHPV